MKKTRDVGRSSVIIIIVVVVVICCLGSDFVEGKELINGKVSKVKNSNSGQSTGPSGLPWRVAVAVRLGQRDVHFTLNKEPGFTVPPPVFLLSTDRRGTLYAHTARLKKDDYAVYQDVTGEAAFGVFLEKDVNGSFHYRLEGIVHSMGKVYSLKSTGKRPKVTHHGQDDLDNVNNDDAVNDDDSEDDESNDEINDSEKMSDEEFEVEELMANFADDDDVLTPDVHTKVKQKVMEMPNEALSLPSLTFPDHSDFPTPSPLPTIPADKRNERRRREERRNEEKREGRGREERMGRRRKRQVSQDIYVDVVGICDYKSYESWYNRSTSSTDAQKKQEAFQNIRRYYAFVMNGVNLLYKSITSLPYTIHIRLVGLVISVTADSSRWTEESQVPDRENQVDGYKALPALAAWAATTDLLPAYDHLMLFTGYNLAKMNETSGNYTDILLGRAYKGTVCDTDGQASSIIEDLGGFQCVPTAAHELGHGLSASHDGENNTCHYGDQYIMAAESGHTNATNKLNPWKFSPCSVNYFNSFFQETILTARGRQCLYNTLSINTTIPDVTSQYPGQLYDPDAQCRMVYGPSSRLCLGPNFGTVEDICTDMFCYDPSTNVTCYSLKAARGTTCGNHKWCINGQCVHDVAAPIANETCVFGDRPGIIFNNTDCASYVDASPHQCYDDVVLTRCCSSCGRHFPWLSGPDVTLQYPGQRYNPDEQCQFVYGPSSRLCRSATNFTAENICSEMFCDNPNDTSSCLRIKAATGTTCGSHKWCVNEDCVHDVTAPEADEYCVFGDQPGIVLQNKDCIDIVENNPSNCYRRWMLKRCCSSCARHFPWLAGPNMTLEYPGQAFDPDHQCKVINGPSSGLCWTKVNATELCGDMYCVDPDDSTLCHSLEAAKGTTCGDHKWCIDGECVHDPMAPTANEHCLFGDQPGLVADNKNCTALIDQVPINCYKDWAVKRCCSSCARHFPWLAGPDVASEYPGQVYNPDEQCKYAYGPSSGFCWGANKAPDMICAELYCINPSDSTSCFRIKAARGTTCGNQKWCDNEQCVPDARAPLDDESCMFGDRPGVAFNGQDCSSFVDDFPGYCYQDVVLTRCCSSCARHYRQLKGCTYGDSVTGCNQNNCHTSDTSSLQQCCGTCNYGDPFTTRPSTLFPPATFTTPSGTCEDSPTFTSHGKHCMTLVASQPDVCHSIVIRSQCCQSCRVIDADAIG